MSKAGLDVYRANRSDSFVMGGLMKKCANFVLWLLLLFCFSNFTMAQGDVDCDQLRNKIAQLEKMDLNTMSPSIRQLYKESMAKLYTQFSECLQKDILATVEMQKALTGTTAAQAVEDKLRSLNKEKADADAKVMLFREALRLAASPVSDIAAKQPVRSENEANSEESSALNAPAGVKTASDTPSPARSDVGKESTFDCAPPAAYTDAPILLTDIVARDAADAVDKDKPVRAVASISKMILYTIFDAASPASSKQVRSLEAYQYLGETARTDKQLGSSPNSDGAVSAIEKPGFAQLLGFAIEHGGITKKNDGTNLTLSTSLYSLYTLNHEDTAETYDRAGILNRVGISASFAVDNKTNELANARRNNLSEWSVKARLFGDRSTRSSHYREFWDSQIRPVIRRRLLALGGAIEGLAQHIPGYNKFEGDFEGCLLTLVKDRMNQADYKAANPDDRKKMLSSLMLGLLRSNVFKRVEDGRLQLGDEVVKLIEGQYLPTLKTALDNAVLADKELKKEIDNLQKGPLGTFAYTNYRIPTGSDYSEAKFLFEQDKSFMRPLKLTGNFGLSFYNKPDPTLKQQKLRDVSAALSFEGTSSSPFTEAENQSKITYSFVGRYERLFENRRLPKRIPDIGTFQFVVEIPFFKGLSLPLSATYANATEEEKKTHFRFNFGMRLDTDKLFELLKTGANH
jgi:hypothetical protein